jgi:hypothetical protein
MTVAATTHVISATTVFEPVARIRQLTDCPMTQAHVYISMARAKLRPPPTGSECTNADAGTLLRIKVVTFHQNDRCRLHDGMTSSGILPEMTRCSASAQCHLRDVQQLRRVWRVESDQVAGFSPSAYKCLVCATLQRVTTSLADRRRLGCTNGSLPMLSSERRDH